MSNESRTRTTSVIGPSRWLQPVLDLLHPKQRRTFCCITCGDRFEVDYRVGCFGPIGGEFKPVPPRCLTNPLDERILCAHCGHWPWRDPDQALLRQARALQSRLEDKVSGDLRIILSEETRRRQQGWAAQLGLEDFRELDPIWFAALWEAGPSPNQRARLPKAPKKKVRFYLRNTIEKLGNLPPFPPPGPDFTEACAGAFNDESQELCQLLPELLGKGPLLFLSFVRHVPFADHRTGPPNVQPEPGPAIGYYRLHQCSGDQMAENLRQAIAEALSPKANLEVRLEILEDRMMQVVGQNLDKNN